MTAPDGSDAVIPRLRAGDAAVPVVVVALKGIAGPPASRSQNGRRRLPPVTADRQRIVQVGAIAFNTARYLPKGSPIPVTAVLEDKESLSTKSKALCPIHMTMLQLLTPIRRFLLVPN